MMPRPPPLLAIWHFQRPSECQWMRSGQDGHRRQPFRVPIRNLPCEAGTPVVADEMEAPIAMANGGDDIECIVGQSVHLVTGVIGRIRPGACGISPLVWGDGEMACLPNGMHLGISEVPRNAETMQHQDERIVVLTFHRHVEHHARCRLQHSRFDHPNLRGLWVAMLS